MKLAGESSKGRVGALMILAESEAMSGIAKS